MTVVSTRNPVVGWPRRNRGKLASHRCVDASNLHGPIWRPMDSVVLSPTSDSAAIGTTGTPVGLLQPPAGDVFEGVGGRIATGDEKCPVALPGRANALDNAWA